MWLYLIIAIFLFVFSILDVILDSAEKDKLSFVKILFCFVPLVILASIRIVGFDFEMYENSFSSLHFASLINVFGDVQYEPGYILFNILSPSFVFLIFLMGSITLLIKYKFINSVSPYPIVSFFIFYLVYFLNFEMGQYRQALAMSFIMLSVKYFSDKKKFLSIVFLAILFHYSAFIFLLLLVFPATLKKWYFYISLLLLAILFYFTMSPLVFLLSAYLPGFSSGKLLYYLMEEEGQVGISVLLLSVRLFFLILFYCLRTKIVNLGNPIYIHIFNIYFISLFIYIAFAFVPQISGRGGVYFAMFDIILIPVILKAIGDIKLKVSMFLIFSIIYFVIFINFFKVWGISFVPYKTWINFF